MTTGDDATLLASIANGDEKAMEAFYRSYSPMVYQFAQRSLKNETDAAEVMSQVMMEVWKNASSFEGKSTVKTWLFSMTRFKSIDLIRKNSRHEADEYIQEENEESPMCALDDAYAGTQDKERVQKCIGELKDANRQIVYLTFYEGMAYSDISAVLEVPVGTVKTRMMSAKKQLMACLARLLS